MKYIRTRDWVYELNPPDYESPMCLDGKTIVTCVYTRNQEWIAKSDILKQSNTIYRLFDEVVIIHEDGEITQYNVVGDECRHKYDPYYNFDIKHIKLYDGLIKGAIWTNKGLIYVAKLNGKGEWELV